jgi:DNA recombination protein RmuC
MPIETLLIVVIVALVAMVALQLIAVIRGASAGRASAALEERLVALGRDNERLERELRDAIGESRRDASEAARAQREELAAGLARSGGELRDQLTVATRSQNERFEAFARDLAALTQNNETRLEALHGSVSERLGALQEASGRSLAVLGQEHREGRAETSETLRRFGVALDQRLAALGETSERRLGEVRATLEARLKELAADNAAKLEQMRQTVDEKLHATLEQRLSESFKMVSERLEQVHRGLGEMQTLAAGVGDLKRVLTNVKTRGVWGEIQLGALLEQTLAPAQYAANVETRRGSGERVEFAIRLPGRDDAGSCVWLPVDAKFPREDYERLLAAQERADRAAVEEAERALEACIRQEARTIREKYIEPPATTDFAVMFLPIEGLYAEVLRRPGLSELLQREFRVTVTGPTTFSAFLNSLQMGFRTLAIERRSSEVWGLLGAVKSEFGKFAGVLAKTREKLDQASKTIGDAEVRTRAIERRLRDVEALPGTGTTGLLAELGEAGTGSDVP